jgi:hypothetical protein
VGGVVGGRSSRVRRDGRPAISNAIAIAVAIIIVLAGLASFAYMGNVSTEYLGKALPEKLRQEGERGSELLRIYIWSRNHTLEGEPVITILNAWGKDSEIDVLMVANRTGHVVRVLALGPPMKIPASTAVEIRPSDLGLPYRTFGDLIQNIGGILAHTVLGNSFGSTWGMPREEYVFGSIATTAITNVTTTAWVVTGFTSVQEGTTINLYTTLSYPPEWSGNALIIAYDHLGPVGCQNKQPCGGSLCWKETIVWGREKPRTSQDYYCSLCGPAVETAPRFSWYLVENPVKIIRHYGENYKVWCPYGWCVGTLWECSELWTLRNVTISAVEPAPLGYRTVYQVSGSGQAVAGWEQLGGKITFSTYLVPTGTTYIYGYIPPQRCDPAWLTYTTAYLATGVSLQPVTVTGTTTITVTRTLNSPIETVTHTVTGWKPVTTTATYEDKNRIYTFTVVAAWPAGGYWKTCVTSTYGRYVGAVYDAPPYTFTTTTTHTTLLSAWQSITQPYAPQNPQYSQYEEGHLPGTYGPAPNLYFKLVYPIYIIHRYYEKTDCSCESYSPPPGGGVAPPPGNWTGPSPQVCDVVVKRDKQGNYNSTIINCR